MNANGILISLLSLGWLVLILSTVYSTTMDHPQWGLITIIPIGFLQYYFIHQSPKKDKSPAQQDALLRRYAILFGLLLSFLTGIGIQMGFMPYFFHQVIVWPFIVFFVWENVKGLFQGGIQS